VVPLGPEGVHDPAVEIGVVLFDTVLGGTSTQKEVELQDTSSQLEIHVLIFLVIESKATAKR